MDSDWEVLEEDILSSQLRATKIKFQSEYLTKFALSH